MPHGGHDLGLAQLGRQVDERVAGLGHAEVGRLGGPRAAERLLDLRRTLVRVGDLVHEVDQLRVRLREALKDNGIQNRTPFISLFGQVSKRNERRT